MHLNEMEILYYQRNQDPRIYNLLAPNMEKPKKEKKKAQPSNS